jgi:TolA-binding protein
VLIPLPRSVESVPDTPGTRAHHEDESSSESLVVLSRTMLAAPSARPPLASPPADSSPAGVALRRRFEEIQGRVRRNERTEAQSEFRRLAADFPRHSIAPEALYEAAQLEKTSVRSRIEAFREVFDRFPYTIWATRSLLEIGQARFLASDYVGALDALRAYEIWQGEHRATPSFCLTVVYCLLQTDAYAEALGELDLLAVNEPSYQMTEKALEIRAECLIALGRHKEAVQVLRSLLREYPNHAQAPKALLCLGLCYEEIGYAQAGAEVYRQLLTAYPSAATDAPYESGRALERLESIERGILDFLPADIRPTTGGIEMPQQAAPVAPEAE